MLLRILVSNTEAVILGTDHGVQHLQRYLDIFCYRYNRNQQ